MKNRRAFQSKVPLKMNYNLMKQIFFKKKKKREKITTGIRLKYSGIEFLHPFFCFSSTVGLIWNALNKHIYILKNETILTWNLHHPFGKRTKPVISCYLVPNEQYQDI